MWRLLLAVLACAPVLLWGLEGLLVDSDVPKAVERPDGLIVPEAKESGKALDDRHTPRLLIALAAQKEAPDARADDLAALARRRAAELWLAREYAKAFRDPGNEDGEYRTAPEAFAPDRILVKRLTERRNLARDTARAREALAALVRAWLIKCKKAGKLIAFDAADREAAVAFEKENDSKAWMPKAEWQRVQNLIQKLDDKPSPLAQLRLLADVLSVLEPPRGRLSSLDAADARSLARAVYQPLLPDALPRDGEVLLVDNGGQKDAAPRDKVVAETPDRKESLELAKSSLDEFTLNADPKWSTAGFKVTGGAAGYVKLRPTAVTIVRRCYELNRKNLKKDADWRPVDLEDLRDACQAPARLAAQDGYRWLEKSALEAIEKEGKALEKLGPTGANLLALIEMAAACPRLFDPDAAVR